MLELLRQLCEQMKRDLATTETASCSVPPMFVQMLGCPPQLSLDRAGLESASAQLRLVVEDAAARALGGSGLSNSDVELYVMGAGSRLPFVCPLIEKLLGTRARVVRASNTVALGAAKLAAKLAAGKAGFRSTSDVRTRASWRPPARIKLLTPTPTTITTQSSQPRSASQAARLDSQPLVSPESIRIPMARVPAVTPIPSEPRSADSIVPPQPPGSSQAPATTSARPSVQSISVRQISAGHIRNPASAHELLQIPGARSLRDGDLEPITLALLLLLTGAKRRTGVLRVQMDRAEPLGVMFVDGRPMLSGLESSALVERFKLPVGSYDFEELVPSVGTRRQETAIAVVVNGLRQAMRAFDEASMKAALGERMQRAPEVNATHQLRIGSLGLSPIEQRTVKFSLNGKNTGQGVIEHSGIGAQTAMSLLFLLDIFGLVEWKVPEEKPERSMAQELEARARALDNANYFQVLGVHWSANGAEIDAAYRKLVNELAPGMPVHAIAPDACKRMLARVERAKETLSDHLRRDSYRRITYPDINFDGVEDFLEKKHRALMMQDESSEQTREVERRMQELARNRAKNTKPPSKG
jgi:hypothetical protein